MSWPHGDEAPHPRVLAVCTANICRSPFVERLIGVKAANYGLVTSVASAGFLTNGRAADSVMADFARTGGIELRDHSSRLIDGPLIDSADLVITMERRHAREAIVMAPDSAYRVHTLKGLLAAINRTPPAPGSLDDQLREIAEKRTFSDLMGDGGPDEVPDPHKRSKKHYRTAITTLDQLTTELATWLSQHRPV